MKAVILAGGLGSRLSEETSLKPKPMVEIGGRPIIWHIMKTYSKHGINQFIVCCGYKGYVLKEYFVNYARHNSDIRVDLSSGSVTTLRPGSEPWQVTLVDTGEETMTGGRLKRIAKHFERNETFCATYGDGVSDVNITESVSFHRRHGKFATVTAVQPPGRFGSLRLESDYVQSMVEKPAGDGGWINAGFFVLNQKVFEYIDGDETIWEREPLEKLANARQLIAYKHTGFWQGMDTVRDLKHLNKLWATGEAPWM